MNLDFRKTFFSSEKNRRKELTGKGILDRIYVEAAPLTWEVADDSPLTH